MNTIDFLREKEHKSKDDFISKAQYLKDNWSWLKYSYAIAIKVRRRMRELGLTQKGLAKKMECTQQHVSVILSGKANITLETISKLEQALSFELIGQGLQEFGSYFPEKEAIGFLSDSAVNGSNPGDAKTSECVDGYLPRKKKGPKSH